MSRAVNLSIDIVDVELLCVQHDLRISTIESLLSGGSRVVLLDGRDAEKLRNLSKAKLIAGDVKRSPAHVSRQPPSYRT